MTHFHFIGIGGSGLSAIAKVLMEKGNKVSGSDLVMSPVAQELRDLGAAIHIGHQAEHVIGADVIIRSSAIPDSNVEVIAGLHAHIPVIKRYDLLSQLTQGKNVIAFAGTHGKTTTTAMCAWVFSELGLNPSYVIGGVSKNLGTNAKSGKGSHFIIEADEYDKMFLGLLPNVLVITVIEYDHPDCFPSKNEYFQAFLELSRLIQKDGVLIICGDDSVAARLMKTAKGDFRKIAYGTLENCTYKVRDIFHEPNSGVHFTFSFPGSQSGQINNKKVALKIPGSHNALNAATVLTVIDQLNLPVEQAIHALEKYQGSVRRFDILGTAAGITVIDDYAHHPTKIRATLSAARTKYPNQQIWAVWQPHTYSRTQEFIQDFKSAFNDCDHVIVTEIFASREQEQPYSSQKVVELMTHPDARYIADLEDVCSFLLERLQPGDVLLILSAGDADQISRKVFTQLKTRKGGKE